MFVNFTNHSSKHWGNEQLAAAACYGEIVDMPFPAVDSKAGSAEIHREAEKYVRQILALHPDYVLCQGEFTLVYQVVKMLKENNISVGAACSERCVQETYMGDTSRKEVIFQFVQFREY